MEGEELGGPRMYLYSYHRILSINSKKLLSGGFQTAHPDMTRLPMDKVIDFGEENFPCGMGFYVDGSKLYMVGGEWVEKDLAYDEWKLDRSKRDIGISLSMYVADLSDSTVKFSHVHEFEASKPLPMVMKIKEHIPCPPIVLIMQCLQYVCPQVSRCMTLVILLNQLRGSRLLPSTNALNVASLTCGMSGYAKSWIVQTALV